MDHATDLMMVRQMSLMEKMLEKMLEVVLMPSRLR